MMIGFEPAFVIIRIEKDALRVPQSDADFDILCNSVISVIRVYWSRELAQAEAERLNSLNSAKGCHYYVQHTRVQGRRHA